MPQPELSRVATALVTGSSGFIGTHLANHLAETPAIFGLDRCEPQRPPAYTHLTADLLHPGQLRVAAGTTGRGGVVYHLAAAAEVMTPWPDLPDLFASNVQGTYNLLDVLQPRLVVFASSSSVYGNADVEQTDPLYNQVNPQCLYAASKLQGELLLRDWVRNTGNSAIIFRFGNVVGQHCRGLIPHLAAHAMRHAGRHQPVRLRGNGSLIRDYVSVDHVVRVLAAAGHAEWKPGSLEIFNIGTGRGMTNRGVTVIVQQALANLGFPFDATFDDPPGLGEAEKVVLHVDRTVSRFGIAPPGPAEVREVIKAAARACFESVYACS